MDHVHLSSYLNDLVFGFNRRRSHSHAMVFYQVLQLDFTHDPSRYQDFIAKRWPRTVQARSTAGGRVAIELGAPASELSVKNA